MAIKKDTLDQLLDGRDPKEVFNKDGLFDELKKALAERVLNAELDDHLESEAPAGSRAHAGSGSALSRSPRPGTPPRPTSPSLSVASVRPHGSQASDRSRPSLPEPRVGRCSACQDGPALGGPRAPRGHAR